VSHAMSEEGGPSACCWSEQRCWDDHGPIAVGVGGVAHTVETGAATTDRRAPIPHGALQIDGAGRRWVGPGHSAGD
jgi:hypothetical protein